MPGKQTMICPLSDRPVAGFARAGSARSSCDAMKAMASVVVHELNNVLTAAIGNLSLLDDGDLADTSVTAEIVAEALAAARRGVSLSEELEAFAGQLRLVPEAGDANRLVHQAMSRLPQLPKATELRIRLSPRELPLHVDLVRFRQAITGAVIGAIRAMSERVDCLTVETMREAGARGRGLVQVAILCEGASVNEEDIADAMVSFRAGARTGVWGLACVAGFLAQSGGRLTATVETTGRLRLMMALPSSPERVELFPKS